MALNTLKVLADSVETPFLRAIFNTTQSLLTNILVNAPNTDVFTANLTLS
jgi:hypothetical protein